MKKILCADDARLSRKLLREVVENVGCEFLGAKDGSEAVDLLETQGDQICCALLDWNIPDLSGFELLQYIKGKFALQHIPVIMVSAMGHEEKIQKALEAGAVGYVTKPFEPADLSAKIREVLN